MERLPFNHEKDLVWEALHIDKDEVADLARDLPTLVTKAPTNPKYLRVVATLTAMFIDLYYRKEMNPFSMIVDYLLGEAYPVKSKLVEKTEEALLWMAKELGPALFSLTILAILADGMNRLKSLEEFEKKITQEILKNQTTH